MPSAIYRAMIIDTTFQYPWLRTIQNILVRDLNAENIWRFQDNVNINQFMSFAKRKLKRNFKDSWFEDLLLFPSMNLYSSYKTNFGLDDYIL